MQLTKPETRTITRVVGQPSFVESYERTSIYPKVTGYIEKWNVDIGDKVKKDQKLARIFVPELVEDQKTKWATVELDKQRVALAVKVVKVAGADVKAAEARLEEAKAILDQYEAAVKRWDVQVRRLRREVDRGIVDPQVLTETERQWEASIASRNAAKATILKADAELLSRQAYLEQSEVNVKVAQADLGVATSDAKRMDAWVGYLDLIAPYDGIVVARNANTWDFVSPNAGDPTANPRAPHLSPSGNSAPIYVIDRTDIVRVFVDIPEQDANYVRGDTRPVKNDGKAGSGDGTKANVLVRAYRDQPIEVQEGKKVSVTRTSWALNVKSRTLRAEIDLKNPGSQILPGMYAYGKVIISRPGAFSLPMKAISHVGEKTYYWKYEDGKAVRTEVQTGINDGEFIEVTNRQTADSNDWKPIDGTEQVILADDPAILTDGLAVAVGSATPEKKTLVKADGKNGSGVSE